MTTRIDACPSPVADDLALVRSIPPFAPLSDALLARLLADSEIAFFAPGERLLCQLGRDDHALILLSGGVEVVNDHRGSRLTLARMIAPALIGEVGALARLQRSASVIATSDIRAVRVERTVLLDVCRAAPEMLLTVIGYLGGQIQQLNHAMGLYAEGCAAIGDDEFDPSLLDALSHPIAPLSGFATAFEGLARTIAHERAARADMAAAAALQQAMLPHATLDPSLCGCDVAGLMQPAREIGGDFYDMFMLDDDRLVLAIGDICGKGVAASLFMTVTLSMLRLAAREGIGRGSDIAPIIDRVNAALCAQNPSGMFATVGYGVLDIRTRTFDYVSCGHNPPMIRRRNGAIEAMPTGGVPLGLIAGRRFASTRIDLEPGDAVFLFTDGITEANNPGGHQFGEARLAHSLARHRAARAGDLVALIAADVAAFAGSAEQFDDLTCVAAILPGTGEVEGHLPRRGT